jgi:nucleotide-binding universal stress UspA family protein
MMESRASERNVVHTKSHVVLVGMDFSEPANRALRKALELCSQHEKAELHVACIVPRETPKGRYPLLQEHWIVAESWVIEGVFVSLRARIKAELEAFSSGLQSTEQRAPRRVIPHVSVDTPGLGLVQLALDIGADVIVIGAPGQGNAERALGSVAQSTLSLARCTVVLTQPD